ncbi:hypothetical protein HYQ46_004292 [Verticillium longisporum]|nr:hypothetical protein HYQ44_016270 [Verticillium longisporum]KAG7146899.1 hypothetical protein HYQ46_004292 [Verticillium longisporum]
MTAQCTELYLSLLHRPLPAYYVVDPLPRISFFAAHSHFAIPANNNIQRSNKSVNDINEPPLSRVSRGALSLRASFADRLPSAPFPSSSLIDPIRALTHLCGFALETTPNTRLS